MEPVRYIMPFDTTQFPIKIIQGWHGPYSHFDLEPRYGYGTSIDSSHAVDLALPLNTPPIVASRGGRVAAIFTESRRHYDGSDSEIGNRLEPGVTNFIVIDHGDEIFALYSHLDYHSQRVEHNQFIAQGQLLAHTGLSGWIGQIPHLHFAVFRRIPREPDGSIIQAPKAVTIPFKFEGYQGSYEHLELPL